MKQNEKSRVKNPNHDENCKIAGEKMKTSEEEGGGKKNILKMECRLRGINQYAMCNNVNE